MQTTDDLVAQIAEVLVVGLDANERHEVITLANRRPGAVAALLSGRALTGTARQVAVEILRLVRQASRAGDA